MKPTEAKRDFVAMRAEGKSYETIAAALGISKSTCTKWARELESEIDEAKRATLQELAESYGMAKEARLRRLGGTLERIASALDATDFTNIDPAKLLDFQLKYADAVKSEYSGTLPAKDISDVSSAAEILAAFADLYARVRAGSVSADQASKESALLAQILKAYDTVEVKAKIDELEKILLGGNTDDGLQEDPS